jgi:hypothetical protein
LLQKNRAVYFGTIFGIQKKEIIAQKQEKTKKSRIGKTERYFLWLEAMSLEGLKCLKKFWFLLMDPKLPGMP